ncbi:MAG TPA: hypothetical protein VHF22_03735, partial [Planctomycetota bacterium]|nr:hypothetical protein [Planctomycetota bacterium]
EAAARAAEEEKKRLREQAEQGQLEARLELERQQRAANDARQEKIEAALAATEADNAQKILALQHTVDRALATAEEGRLAAQRALREAELAAGHLRGQRGFDSAFVEQLSIELTLTIDGTATTVHGGLVSELSIEHTTWGFSGELAFMISCETAADALVASFTGDKLIEVELKFATRYQPETDAPEPAHLKGIVLERSLTEAVAPQMEGRPILKRRYWIRFADPAAALWTRHFPSELFNDSTFKAILDAYKGAKITIASDWDKVTASHKWLFLGLGDQKNRASFYDFLIWWIHENGGVLTWDVTAGYKIAAAKAADGEAEAIDPSDVASVEAIYPEVPRWGVNVLNSDTVNYANKAVTNDNKVDPIRKDVLVRESITSNVDARVTLETARVATPKQRLKLAFARLPTITYAPGAIVDFSDDVWSSDAIQKSGTYRVRSYRVSARQEAEDVSTNNVAYATFTVRAESELETKDDALPHLPEYRVPRYPVLLEGTIVSEQGETDEETYQIYTDDKTSVDQYKVKVPLWDGKFVYVDFNPNLFPGHFYFPAYKDARVLMDVELSEAWIKRYLDWRPLARTPADGQGNQILMGKKEKNETSILHDYADQKPVLTIKRVNDKDNQTITIKDGGFSLLVQEDAS